MNDAPSGTLSRTQSTHAWKNHVLSGWFLPAGSVSSIDGSSFHSPSRRTNWLVTSRTPSRVIESYHSEPLKVYCEQA